MEKSSSSGSSYQDTNSFFIGGDDSTTSRSNINNNAADGSDPSLGPDADKTPDDGRDSGLLNINESSSIMPTKEESDSMRSSDKNKVSSGTFRLKNPVPKFASAVKRSSQQTTKSNGEESSASMKAKNMEANADTIKRSNNNAKRKDGVMASLQDPFMEIRKSAESKVVGLKDYVDIRNNEWLSSAHSHPPSSLRGSVVFAPIPQQVVMAPSPNNLPNKKPEYQAKDVHKAATASSTESVTEPTPPPLPAGMKDLSSAKQPASKLPKPTEYKHTVEELEDIARQKATWGPFELLFLGNIAALKVVGFYLVTLETFITIALTTGLTIYWYNLYRDADPAEWNGGGLDFVLLAFAVTAPMSAAIGMAFARRERALIAMADFKSFTSHLYMSHCLWDWPEGKEQGREKAEREGRVVWVDHCDAVLAQLIGISDELSRFLTLPAVSRSRHRMTKKGRKEAARTIEVAYQLLESMSTQRLTRLVMYSERLKKIGLPSGEASRVRQFERFISDIIEQLRMIKMYRTPQALRSFARIFTVLLPPFYAPKYAQVAMEMDSLAVGLCFGIITALALTALFESLQILEDPFTAFLALDGIDCREELEVLQFSALTQIRRLVFPDAPDYPAGRRAALTRRNFPNKKLAQVGMPPTQNYHAGTTSSVARPASVRSGITFEGGATAAQPVDNPLMTVDDAEITSPATVEETEHTAQELGEAMTVDEVIANRESAFHDEWASEANMEASSRLRHRRNVSFFTVDHVYGQGQQPEAPPENPRSVSRHHRINSTASIAGSSQSTPHHRHRRTGTNLSLAGLMKGNSTLPTC